MEKSNKNIALYLLLVVGFWVFCFITLKLVLMPYSVAYTQSGKMTAGYFCYAAIGLIFSTPAPFLSILVIALCKERIGLKALFKWIFRTEHKLQTVLLTGGFCLLAFLFALVNGTPNGSAWYMLPLGFLILFDAFPGNVAANIYRVLWLGLSVTLWLWADRKEKQKDEFAATHSSFS